MSWWGWVLLAWLLLSMPVGVLVGRMIRTGQAGEPCAGCAHARVAHEHYRPGNDCGLCGCPAFVRARQRRARPRRRSPLARGWLWPPAPRRFNN